MNDESCRVIAFNYYQAGTPVSPDQFDDPPQSVNETKSDHLLLDGECYFFVPPSHRRPRILVCGLQPFIPETKSPGRLTS